MNAANQRSTSNRAPKNDSDRDHFPDGAVDPGNLPRVDAGALSRRNDSQLAISRPELFPGLNAARCRKRDRVHHFLRRGLWLRDHSLLPQPAAQHESGLVVVWIDGCGDPARGGSHSLGKGDGALHILSAATRASRLLCRRSVTRHWFVDRVLQLVAALLQLETRAQGRESAARCSWYLRNVHYLADRDHAGRNRSDFPADPMVYGVGRRP